MPNLKLTSVAVAALLALPNLASAQAPGAGDHGQGAADHGPGGGGGERGGDMERHEKASPPPGAAGAPETRKAQAEPKRGDEAEKPKPGGAPGAEKTARPGEGGAKSDKAAEGDEKAGSKTEKAQDKTDKMHDKTGAADRAGMTKSSAKSVKITSEQQTKIRTTIRNTHVENISHVDFSINVGTVVPRRYHWNPLPPEIIEIVPEYRGYDFIEVTDEILIIDPGTGEIVYVIS